MIPQATTSSVIRILNRLRWLTDMIRRHPCLPYPTIQLISSPLPRPQSAVPVLPIRRRRHNLRFIRTSSTSHFRIPLASARTRTTIAPVTTAKSPRVHCHLHGIAAPVHTGHQFLCLLSYTPVSLSSIFRQCSINEYKTSAHIHFFFPFLVLVLPLLALPTQRTVRTVTIRAHNQR